MTLLPASLPILPILDGVPLVGIGGNGGAPLTSSPLQLELPCETLLLPPADLYDAVDCFRIPCGPGDLDCIGDAGDSNLEKGFLSAG
jgi:hypothetical protein